MKATTKRELDDTQDGFQEGGGTAEQIRNLRMPSENYLENHIPL